MSNQKSIWFMRKIQTSQNTEYICTTFTFNYEDVCYAYHVVGVEQFGMRHEVTKEVFGLGLSTNTLWLQS